MPFIKAKAGPPNVGDSEKKFTVQFFDEEGNMTIRSGGTRAWRCNNPGALLSSKYSTGKDRRSIGTAGYGKYVYAVYPNYETGHEALIVMLKGSKYFHLTLREASLRYVEEDSNHVHKIAKISKLDPDRTIRSLNPDEFERYWKAIEKNEEWTVGEEDFIEKWYISGVRLKRGVIQEYCIQKNGHDFWISKHEAIVLAEEQRLHAIVVHPPSGKLYLRPEYHGKSFKEMVC